LLPPTAIVLITGGTSPASPPSPPYADAYDFTDCDGYVPPGLSIASATKPTLFQYSLEQDGTVHGASLYRSSGNDGMDKAALVCANRSHTQEAMVAGTPARILWVGGILWAGPRHGLFEPSPDGAPAATCKPWYPPQAFRIHKQGDAIIGFRVGADGNPKDETVVRSGGSISLDDAARSCVHSFRYFPASENGQPAELDKTARIEFRILGF
jgi:TonB family protein